MAVAVKWTEEEEEPTLSDVGGDERMSNHLQAKNLANYNGEKYSHVLINDWIALLQFPTIMIKIKFQRQHRMKCIFYRINIVI